MRGFVSEIIAIVVVILGVIGARLWAPPFSAWLLAQFAWPQGVCDAVAYTLLFLAIAIVLSVAARFLNKLMRAIHLGWANRLAGGLFGLAKYGLLVLIAVFILDRTNDSLHYLDEAPVVKTSVVYPQMVKLTHALLSFSGK
jgi:membrane protein required for colicin V production